MALPESFIRELLDRSDIEQIVSSYVPLKRRGRHLVGLCPFHGEKTPSFTVFPETSSFYCFGCSTGGDVITFVRMIERLDYLDAVRLLADRAGMRMPETGGTDAEHRLRMRVLEANREAARQFHEWLYQPIGKEGLDYFHSRGLTDATIRRFGLGFAPNDYRMLRDALRAKGFHDEELVAAFLCKRGQHGLFDLFRNRVIIPIIDLRGNVVAFGGRVLDDSKPKYLNSADTPVFKKTNHLFALNFAKSAGNRLLLCEGYMDVIALHQAGFKNAVAALGTSFTQDHARLLARYTQDNGEVLLVFDADAAGQKATARAITILREAGVNVRVITVPDGKDPDEFIRKRGADAFRLLIERASNDTEYRLLELARQHTLSNAEGRIAYLRKAAQLLSGLTDPIERDLFAGQLASELSVSKEAILQQIRQEAARHRKKEADKPVTRIVRENETALKKVNAEAAAYPRAAAAEEALIGLILHDPGLLPRAREALSPQEMLTAFNRSLYQQLLDRDAQGLSNELPYLSGIYESEEMSYITRMVQGARSRPCTADEVRHLAEVLRQERQNSALRAPDELSPEQIRELLQQMRKDKA